MNANCEFDLRRDERFGDEILFGFLEEFRRGALGEAVAQCSTHQRIATSCRCN